MPLRYVLTAFRWPSVLAGLYANTRLSSYAIHSFVQKNGINVDEIEQPLTSFTTFNEFFTRRLKKESRAIDASEKAIVSPADGKILVLENIGKQTLFPIKGVTLTIQKLVHNNALAQMFKGGIAFIVRLRPQDYHRMHFPVSGIPSPATIINGKYESVNPYVYTRGIQPLEVNERHLIMHHTQSIGSIGIIPVGALFVGAIRHTYTPNSRYEKGDEFGYFAFGGSTIVLLFQADSIVVHPAIKQNSAIGKETDIKMGQSIAHIA